MARSNIRLKLARAILGNRAKEFIPALSDSGLRWPGQFSRVNGYTTKADQLAANVGWCFTANNAIAEPFSAIEIKLYRKNAKGERAEVNQHPILDLIDNPSLALTGEQLRQLHCTYMNFTGESYLLMRKGANPFEPGKGKLPDAIDIFPSHQVGFTLGDTYSKSTVRLNNNEYPITAFVRDINPDPNNPYRGRSIVTAAAQTLDMEDQMKRWNQSIFANGGHPSLVFTTNESMSDSSYERWKQQFNDEHTGADNAGKPLLIENGDVKPYMMNAKDLDFLKSRQFSKDEILAMWRVSPDLIGYTANSNRATMDAAMYLHALINLVPRIRQFVRQLNAAMVKPFDPNLELDFVSPVPEDVEAKIKYAETASGRWLLIDEVRDLFGEKPLPNGLGQTIYMSSSTASLEDIADGASAPATTPADNQPADQPADDGLPEDTPTKALAGVKKKT